jgi:hypothetical protein
MVTLARQAGEGLVAPALMPPPALAALVALV